jgi:hypothetical protein
MMTRSFFDFAFSMEGGMVDRPLLLLMYTCNEDLLFRDTIE